MSPEGDFSAQIYFFNELLPPEGDFSAHIYFFNELLPPEGDFSAQIYFFNDLFKKYTAYKILRDHILFEIVFGILDFTYSPDEHTSCPTKLRNNFVAGPL